MTSIHFVGVMNSSMASLAMMARLNGHRVTGSDDHIDSLYAPVLEQAGVKLFDMFAQANINQPDLVVVSRFFDDRHPEYLAASATGVPIIRETDYLSQIIGEKPIEAVLGMYEAPFISAWLLHVRSAAGKAVCGLTGVVSTDGSLAQTGESTTCVIPFAGMKKDWHTYEPDFLTFNPTTVIVPSIMYDFPDLAMTLDDVYQNYFTFVKRVPRNGLIIGNSDWSRMKRMRIHLADRKIETYGFDRDAMWQIRDVSYTETTSQFSIKTQRQLMGPFTIPFSGRFFVSAATAVIVSCLIESMSLDVIGKSLATLPRVRRYFETRTDSQGRVIIDDCADNPATIEDVLLLIKERYPTRKIWCLYQSSSFLRLKALQSEFEAVLSMADYVYIADICGQPKEKSEGVHARHIVASLRAKKAQTYYIESVSEMADLLTKRATTQDCIVTLGANGICQESVAMFLGESTQ